MASAATAQDAFRGKEINLYVGSAPGGPYDAYARLVARHLGKLVTHRQLLNEVWGPQYGSETHYLRVHVAHIRAKIEPDPQRPRYLLTDPGVGYRLREPG